MDWGLAGLVLILVGYFFRRLLRLDRPVARLPIFLPLSSLRNEIYQPVALEIETQATILGISLNEALGEHEAGHLENAWRLVRLAVCQWDRLAENASVMLNTIMENMPPARSVVTVPNIAASRFRSREMTEFVRMWDLAEQMIFRSKLRYQLHVHVLLRAAEILTATFRRNYRAAGPVPVATHEAWNNLDPAFHDFDLIVKESLLCFRGLLISLPDAALQDMAAELSGILAHSVRSSAVVAAPRHAGF